MTVFGEDILKLWASEGDASELFTKARQVEELTAHPGWRAVQELLDTQRERAMARLMHGAKHSEAQLRHELGLLRGLDLASVAAHAITQAPERAERKFQEQQAAESVAEGSQQ